MNHPTLLSSILSSLFIYVIIIIIIIIIIISCRSCSGQVGVVWIFEVWIFEEMLVLVIILLFILISSPEYSLWVGVVLVFYLSGSLIQVGSVYLGVASMHPLVWVGVLRNEFHPKAACIL